MAPYIHPTALLYGGEAARALAGGLAGRLAGGPIGFAQVELIEGDRNAPKHRVFDYRAARAIKDSAVRARLDAIEAPRADVAGLSGSGPFVMGIVNVTPDSFSDGGEHEDPKNASDFARSLIAQGADIVDIGGESTRPGAQPVPTDLELQRVLPVIADLAGAGAPLSIDTRKPEVMRKAVAAGAAMINDVSALCFDEISLATAAQLNVPVIMMHTGGAPATMQDDPRYDNVLLDIYDYFASRVAACENAGLDKALLIADPGIGFGKTTAHNLELIRGFGLFHGLGVALALGTSRKGFIGAVTGVDQPRQRLPGSLVSVLAGADRGAHILRVHDVAETVRALAVKQAILQGP